MSPKDLIQPSSSLWPRRVAGNCRPYSAGLLPCDPERRRGVCPCVCVHTSEERPLGDEDSVVLFHSALSLASLIRHLSTIRARKLLPRSADKTVMGLLVDQAPIN